MLLDLHLLGLSSQGRTVSDTELTSDSDLLSSLSPELLVFVKIMNSPQRVRRKRKFEADEMQMDRAMGITTADVAIRVQ